MNSGTADNSQAVVEEAFARVENLATLPEITVRIIEVVDDPNATADDLHAVLRCDPVLSSKVLRVVNSAFYGLPGQVASLDRAIILLGQSVIRNIAIAASLVRFFTGPENSGRFDPKQLWRHSVAVAVAAKVMNDAGLRALAADEVFLAGLLHDLGLIAERQAFPDALNKIVQLCKGSPTDFLQLERRVIGATHQDFGAAMTARWSFPPSLRAAAGSHHAPAALPAALRPLGAVLRCADVLCCHDGLGFEFTARDAPLSAELLAAAGLTDAQLSAIRDTLAAELTQAEAILGNGS